MRIESKALMTLVIYGTFSCSETDLSDFLKRSRLLPDKLTAGINPLSQIGGPVPWWQPQELKGVSGTECNWEADPDIASCSLAAGRSDDKGATVYFMVVYEQKAQTGLSPEAKADPKWPNKDMPDSSE